jgi:ABC-type multidrug transport system fused ATPase/permease subunit
MASILPNVLIASLRPVQGWLAKNVLDQVTRGDVVFSLIDLLPYAWLALGAFFGLVLLYIIQRITHRMFSGRIFILLQRVWFDQCGVSCTGERVARAMNDCESAGKIFELFQRDIWVAFLGLYAVLIWQVTQEPRWIPALLLAALPPFIIAILFGGLIQRTSHRILLFVAAVGSAVGSRDRRTLYERQEEVYKQRVRFEMWKQLSETTAEFSRWLGVVIVLLLSTVSSFHLIPSQATAGELGLFLVNLALLTQSLLDITKVHNKVREGLPAIRRVLSPSDDELPGERPVTTQDTVNEILESFHISKEVKT